MFQYLLVRLKVCQHRILRHALVFQYLLVRLKGGIGQRQNDTYVISIPLGTIKSNISRNVLCNVALFQYLLVRLKAPQMAQGATPP